MKTQLQLDYEEAVRNLVVIARQLERTSSTRCVVYKGFVEASGSLYVDSLLVGYDSPHPKDIAIHISVSRPIKSQ
jgi:hypothetical protein